MLISRKSTVVSDHLNRATLRKYSGIRPVTSSLRSAEQQRDEDRKRESPFGQLVYGSEAGMPQTAYKPILPMY